MPWTPLPGDGPGPRPVAEALDGVLARVGAPRAVGIDRVFDGWDELAGPTLATAARPVSLRDGILVLAVDDPAWATQLRYLQSELVARFADVAPEARIESVEVRVRSTTDRTRSDSERSRGRSGGHPTRRRR